MLKEALTSKKFVAACAASIAAAALKLGIDLPTDAIMAILSPLLTYIVGQGMADIGKHVTDFTVTQKQQ